MRSSIYQPLDAVVKHWQAGKTQCVGTGCDVQGVIGIRVADHHIIHPISAPIAALGSIVTLNALEGKINNLHVSNLEMIMTWGHPSNRLNNSSVMRLDTSIILVEIVPKLDHEITLLVEPPRRSNQETNLVPPGKTLAILRKLLGRSTDWKSR